MQIMRRNLKKFTVHFLVTVAVGIVAGIGGTGLAMLLRYIQHHAYGYSLDSIITSETFLEGVIATSAARRVIILLVCGLIAGFGWWLLYKFLGKPAVISEVVHSSKPRMPIPKTIIHALLQIFTVALGSPLGREVAPREIGAAFATWICNKTKISLKSMQILIACGAGGGLAAVYNVPFGSVFFILEGILRTWRWPAVINSITVCAIAVLISWWGLGNTPTYHNVPKLDITTSLTVWAIVVGPIFGITGYWFNKMAQIARKQAQHDWHQVMWCLLNFTIIGALAIYFPALLGNGKSPAELEFSGQVGFFLTFNLLILRTLVVWSSFRAGAHGGMLTPSVANGALLAVLLSFAWTWFWPGTHYAAFAIVGAAAFLACSQKMPLTAIVLMLEFTRVKLDFLIPMFFATAGGLCIMSLIEKHE